MSRVAWFVLLASFVGCQKYEPPDPGPAPSASVVVKPAAEPKPEPPTPPPPPPPPAPKALPDVPPVELACAKDTDCDATFSSDACCSICEPRVGAKAWTKKMDAFCKKPEHKNPECKPLGPCGFVFGKPRCRDGRCLVR